MTAKTRRRSTDEQRAQKRAQDRERMEQAAKRLLTSDGWQQWVRVRSRNGLARYSLVICRAGCRQPQIRGLALLTTCR